MKVLVCGGRNYSDFSFMENILNQISITSIVNGGASGADSLSTLWAKKNNIPFYEIKANWEFYGKKAGPIRNKLMLDTHPDIELIVVFSGGKGTQNMVIQAQKAKKQLLYANSSLQPSNIITEITK